MERVAFLLEQTGTRLGCLLNPESLVVRRLAGVRPRRSAGGAVTGAGRADDPLLFTGGGTTELLLDLLFDVTLAGSSIATDDVRELTAPFWDLAENAPGDNGYAQPPLVRFVWGKTWNIPGIVAAVAERLEYFTPAGAPQRSWIRMRFLRVAELSTQPRPAGAPRRSFHLPPEGREIPPDQVLAHEVAAGERLDEITQRYYGDPALWRLLATFNRLDDPLRLEAGQLLQVPPLSAFEGAP